MLRVTDLDRSIKFYTEALGMKLLRTRDNPDNKYKLEILGKLGLASLHWCLVVQLPTPLKLMTQLQVLHLLNNDHFLS